MIGATRQRESLDKGVRITSVGAQGACTKGCPCQGCPCPRRCPWGLQGAEHPSARSAGWDSRAQPRQLPLPSVSAPRLGPAEKSWGESSALGNGRLMGTVHLTNCRESEEVIQSESECVRKGEGRIPETMGLFNLTDKGRTRFSFSKLKSSKFSTGCN